MKEGKTVFIIYPSMGRAAVTEGGSCLLESVTVGRSGERTEFSNIDVRYSGLCTKLDERAPRTPVCTGTAVFSAAWDLPPLLGCPREAALVCFVNDDDVLNEDIC
jgi:hypothetical protein